MTLRETTPPAAAFERAGVVARMALALTAWTERWVPDAFVFALVGTVIVVIAGTVATPSSLAQVIDAWGSGFWELIPFTLQMSLIIITGHVLATSAPMSRLIRVLASWPRTPKSAVAMVTFFAMASSWFNWGFSLIFSAVLAREVARRAGGRRLPRPRRRQLPGYRQRLGAGPQRIGGVADGHGRARFSRRFATSSRTAASSRRASSRSATPSSFGRASSLSGSR